MGESLYHLDLFVLSEMIAMHLTVLILQCLEHRHGFPSKNAGPQTQPVISHLNIGGKGRQKGKDCLNQALSFFMGDETPIFHHDFPQVLRCFSHP